MFLIKQFVKVFAFFIVNMQVLFVPGNSFCLQNNNLHENLVNNHIAN